MDLDNDPFRAGFQLGIREGIAMLQHRRASRHLSVVEGNGFTLQKFRNHIDTIPPYDICSGAYWRDYDTNEPGCAVGHLMKFSNARYAAEIPLKCPALAKRLRLIQETNDASARGLSRKTAILDILDSFILEDAVSVGAPR